MATVSTSTELDSLFLKGLKLLQSRKTDSAAQLRLLMMSVIHQDNTKDWMKKDEPVKALPIMISDESNTEDSPVRKDVNEKKEVSDKKSKMEIVMNIDEVNLFDPMPDIKVIKSKEVKATPKPSKEVYKEVKPVKPVEISSDSDTEIEDMSPGMDTGDFAEDMGLVCLVCRQFGVSTGNQLVECLDCRSLYHQECHKPPVTEDVNEPRFVWYCSKCSKNMYKLVGKTAKSKGGSPAPSPSSTTTKSLKTESLVPFKRLETSKGGKDSLRNTPFSGLASLGGGNKTETVKATKVDKLPSRSAKSSVKEKEREKDRHKHSSKKKTNSSGKEKKSKRDI